MTLSDLLIQLGMETKLDLAAAIEAGGCTIQFDASLDIVLESDSQTGALHLYHAIADVPGTNRENFFAALLQLHLFGMATDDAYFGFDPQPNRVLFFKTLPLPTMNGKEAIKKIESFVNQAERWKTRLTEVVARMEIAAAESVNMPSFGVAPQLNRVLVTKTLAGGLRHTGTGPVTHTSR